LRPQALELAGVFRSIARGPGWRAFSCGITTMTNALRSKHPGGRPSKYRREFAPLAHALCWRGATDCDLAQAFGVTTVTIWRWRAKHEEFCNAVREGKGVFDDRVERSLAMRAMGYTYHAEKVFHFQGRVIRATTVEHLPPDPGAAKFWLCNRRPDKWRNNA
jgi:hypothetical protein